MTSNNSKLNGTGGISNLTIQLPKKNKYSISIYSNPYNINIPFINQPKKQNVSTMYKATSDKIQNINPQKKKNEYKLTLTNLFHILQTTTAPFNKCINQSYQTKLSTQKNQNKKTVIPAKITNNNNNRSKNYSISITKRKNTLDAHQHQKHNKEDAFNEIEKKIAVLKKQARKNRIERKSLAYSNNINNSNNNLDINNVPKKIIKKNSFSISINPLQNITRSTRNNNSTNCSINAFSKHISNIFHHERATSFSYRDIPLCRKISKKDNSKENNINNIKKDIIKKKNTNIPKNVIQVGKEKINNKIIKIKKKGIIPCFHNTRKRPPFKEQTTTSLSKNQTRKQINRPDSSLSKVKTTDATSHTSLNKDSYCVSNNNININKHLFSVNNSLFDDSYESIENDSFNDINTIVRKIHFEDVDLHHNENDIFAVNNEGKLRTEYNKYFDNKFMAKISMKNYL